MASWMSVVCSLAVALCLTGPIRRASAASLLSYGTEHGDTLAVLETTSVTLTESFTFLGESFAAVRVNSNGALQWGPVSGTNEKFIAPFFGDADMSSGGSVYYRSTSNSSLLQQVSDIVTASFAGTTGLTLSSLFVTTWYHIPANGQPVNLHNTFQCVLAYSGSVSYVLFLYEDGAMRWTRGADSEPALVGFKNGESRQLILPPSRTDAVLEVAEASNTGVAGRWLFRVDGTQVLPPAPLVGLETVPQVSEAAGSQSVCVVLLSRANSQQELSLSLRVNGEVGPSISFPAAGGPARRCAPVTITDDRVVEYDETVSVELTNSGGGLLTIFPASTTISILDDDVVVGWESVDHSVSEDVGSVQLCAVLETAQELSAELTVSLVTRGNGVSATDYSVSGSELTFEPGTTRACMDVSVRDDDAVENDESLSVTLDVTDDRVVLNPRSATITIRDNGDSIYVRPRRSELSVPEQNRILPVCVVVSGTIERNFDLGLNLHGGTAQAGVHFTDASGVTTIPAGTQNHCFPVTITNDNIYNIGSIDFSGSFSSTDPGVRVDSSVFPIHITEDDAKNFRITFSRTLFTGSEDDSTMDVCVKVVEGQLGPGSHVDVNLTTNTFAFVIDRRKAIEKVDYAESERVIRFDSSHTSSSAPECVSIPIIDDDILEDRETYLMEVKKVDEDLPYRLEPFTVYCAIDDNDMVTATVENTHVTVAEGIDTVAEVCVVVHDERVVDLNMRATPSAFNATAGRDFDRTAIDFTLSKDADRACVNVPILNDFKLEALYERFFVDFSSSSRQVVFNQSRAVVTIKDTDKLLYRILAVPGFSNVEETEFCTHNNTGRLCITTAGKLDINIAISFHTMDGTAVAGEDYTPFNETRVVRPEDIRQGGQGSWNHCLGFCTKDDNIVEGDESFYIIVSPHTNRVMPYQSSKDRLQVTIHDNDVLRVYPTVSSLSVGEGDGRVEICANMVGLSERPIDLLLETTDYTAREGVDYEIVNSSIHFPSYLTVYGRLSAAQVAQFAASPPVTTHCVEITIIDDDVLERTSSKVFAINFSSQSLDSSRIIIESGVTITIEDDDQVILSLDNATTVIGEADQRVRLQLSLVGAADFEISASIDTRSTDGPNAATPEEDYSVVRGTSVVLPAGYATGDALDVELTVPIRDDSLFEGTETFEVVLSTSSEGVVLGTPFVKTIQIEDNDGVEVGLTDGEFRVLEGDLHAPVCSYLRGATQKSVLVNVTTSPGTAEPGDYITPVSAQFVFPPSQDAQQTQCIRYVVVDDDILEAVESFFVEISTSVPRVTVGRSTATVSLVDNDGVYMSLVERELSVEEDAAGVSGGQVQMCVRMTGIIQRELEVRLFTEAGTAQANSDFVSANRSIRFKPMNQINQTNCTSFTFLNDAVAEETEVFFVNLTTSSVVPGNISILTNRARVQILDSDLVSITFEHSSYSVTEGEDAALEVCVELGASTEKEIVVQFSAVAETAQHYSDFSQEDSQLTFQARGSTRECTSIVVMDDQILEDEEQFTVYILFSDPALYIPDYPTLSNSSAVVTIEDNDHITVWLESSLYQVGEGVGQVSVCIILNGTTGKEVPITLSSHPGTARNGSVDPGREDYRAPAVELTFAVSSESQQRVCAEVSVVDDDRVEDVETFHLEISTRTPRIRLSHSTATVRIEDDDVVSVAMTTPELSVEEGEEVRVCVTRSGVIEKTVTVDLSLESRTAQAGSDFNNEHITIQFSPSPVAQRNECTTFSTLQDQVVELTEVFAVKLTSSAAFVSIGLNETVVSINDSDTTSVEFELSSYPVNEAEESLEVCVVLGAVIEREASVRLVTGDVTAHSVSDYTQTDVTLTFQSLGSTRLCASVPITNDNVVEETERFLVFLTTADEALHARGDAVSVTVTDNDQVTVSLERAELSVEEEEGEVELCVRLVGAIEKDVTVLLAPAPGTAHAGRDYLDTTKSILFQPSLSSVAKTCTTFEIENDQLVEATESFFIQLATTGDEQIILDRDRTRVIVTDTDVVYVNFTQLSQTVSEVDTSVSVCVELESVVESPVTVQLATDSDTAHQPRDFTTAYETLTFEPRGDTRLCVSIAVHDDDILEEDEQFLVYIFDSERSRVRENDGGRGYVEIVVDSGSGEGEVVEVLSGGVKSVVVIRDDDTVRIGMTVTEYTVEESQSEVTVCMEMEGEIERKVDVSLQAVSGTARVGNDFFSTKKSVTFGPQSAVVGECVRVQLIDRPEIEPDERFSVRLSSSLEGSVVLLDPKEASILILDDDVVCVAGRTVSPRGEYRWEESKPGMVRQPCQENSGQGVAERRCNRDGVWNRPILDSCYRDVDKIFQDLKTLPFNCLNFHELLLAITQATEEKDFEVEYISIVARFFIDFAGITSREGYVTENMVCREDLDTFTVGVSILDQLFLWPQEVVWTNSTSIILNFEVVSKYVVANPEFADKTIPRSSIAFSSSLDERADLEKEGIVREFSGNTRGALKVSAEEGKAGSGTTVLGTVQLPASLFQSLADKEAEKEVGVWFSLHRTAHLFPLVNSENYSVSTPVISAALGRHRVEDLEEPLRITLRLLNQSVTDTTCASWNHKNEEWVRDGCVTVSVKDGYVTCECNHLTNFAGVGASLLPTVLPLPQRPSLALSIVSLVGVMLALLALVLTIFVLLAFGKLRRRRTTLLRAQLCSSLLFLLLAYVGHIIVDHTGALPQDIVPACAVISTFTHYFTLTSLIWLGAESLLMFRKLVFGERLGDLTNLYFVTASATSWLLPFPFASIPAVLNRDWIITEDQYCFISSLPVFVATFVIPASIAVFFNLAIYLGVMCIFIRFKCKKQPPLTDATASKKKKKMKKSRREATIRLIFSSPVIGTLFVLGWIFASLTLVTAEASIAFHLLSAIFTAALGWFIFIYYIVTAKDTRRMVYEAFCGKPKKNLNANQFLSMESLGKASGIDESDSDSDYPERERRYGEFDVTYVGRKAALIEQKFSVRWGDGEGGGRVREDGSRAEEGHSHSVGGQIVFAAFTPSAAEPRSSSAEGGDTNAAQPRSMETVEEDPEEKSGKCSPVDDSPVHLGSHSGSQEDVDSDEGSPKASTTGKNFLPPVGQIVFTVTPTT